MLCHTPPPPNSILFHPPKVVKISTTEATAVPVHPVQMDGNFTHLIYNIQFPVSNVAPLDGHINTVNTVTVNTQNLQNAETVMNFSVKGNNVIETIPASSIPTVTTVQATVVEDKSSKRYTCDKCSLVFKHKEMHRNRTATKIL